MAVPPDPHPIVVVGFDGSPASHVALSRAIQRVGPDGKLYLVARLGGSRGVARTRQAPAVRRPRPHEGGGRHGVRRRGPPRAQGHRLGARADRRPGGDGRSPTSHEVRRADEIILGTRGFGRVRALLGSVAHELIHLAACPVTVIPERMVEQAAEARERRRGCNGLSRGHDRPSPPRAPRRPP